MLLTLDLFLKSRGYALRLDAGTFHAENTIISSLRSDPDLFRFHVLPQAQEMQVPVKTYAEAHQNREKLFGNDLMMEHHISDITGYNIPLQHRYERLIGLILSKPLASLLPLRDMLNIKYVPTEKPVDLKGLSWVLDGPATSKLNENQYYLSRAFLAEQFEVLKSDQEFARAFHELILDPRTTTLLEREPVRFLELKKKARVLHLVSEVRVLSYENNRIVLEVDTP